MTTVPYTSINVLLVFWEDDDLRVWDEVDQLEKVFRIDYGTTTKTFKIPAEGSAIALDNEIVRLQENEDPNTLLILYYAGHGKLRDGALTIQAHK